jgi:hypothetical protein
MATPPPTLNSQRQSRRWRWPRGSAGINSGVCSLCWVSSPLFDQFAARARLPDSPPLRQVVNAVQAIPYGRPLSRTTQGVLREWKGTCSTKHALLAQLLCEQWPGTSPRLVHRVYRVTRAAALARYGGDAATTVPDGGLTDVHRYLVITLDGQDVTIDITFPGDPAWDGHRSMPLACGDGRDYPAGTDPDADKTALETSYCDPRHREPFIAALALASARADPT